MIYSFKIAKFWLLALVICFCMNVQGQEKYKNTLKIFRKNYVQTHDVVKGDSTKFLKFFPIYEKYAELKELIERIKAKKETKYTVKEGKVEIDTENL